MLVRGGRTAVSGGLSKPATSSSYATTDRSWGMGSRAVVVVCRDPETAAARFGMPAGTTGVVHTRTGRPFFGPALTEDLLAVVRDAATAAGVWDQLGSPGWLVLDCELMPWSVKADELLRTQYASVGAAARAALPAAVAALETAAASGLPVDDLLARTRSREANADGFTEAYRRYIVAHGGT